MIFGRGIVLIMIIIILILIKRQNDNNHFFNPFPLSAPSPSLSAFKSQRTVENPNQHLDFPLNYSPATGFSSLSIEMLNPPERPR